METSLFSVGDLIDSVYQLKQRAKEKKLEPTQFVVRIRPDIYNMIEDLAQENHITWEEAWAKLLNGEFRER